MHFFALLRHSSVPLLPSPFLDFRLLVGVLLVKLVSLEAGGTVAPTRGRLSPAMPLPLPTTLLVAMDTTSTDLATLTLTGLPRASTRGRLSLAMPLPLPTTLLADMATTSTAPATLTLTGAPRVFTRGRLPATATSLLSAPTVMATTARTPSTVSRSTAMRPTSTRTARDTKAL